LVALGIGERGGKKEKEGGKSRTSSALYHSVFSSPFSRPTITRRGYGKEEEGKEGREKGKGGGRIAGAEHRALERQFRLCARRKGRRKKGKKKKKGGRGRLRLIQTSGSRKKPTFTKLPLPRGGGEKRKGRRGGRAVGPTYSLTSEKIVQLPRTEKIIEGKKGKEKRQGSDKEWP